MKILTDLNLESFSNSKGEIKDKKPKPEEKNSEVRSSSFDDIRRIPLEEFAKTNTILKVYSELLGETIYFAPSEAVIRKCGIQSGPVYSSFELQKLYMRMSQHDLEMIHEAKKIFGGKIL